MITAKQLKETQKKTLQQLAKAKIVLTNEEKKHVEVADFGLNELKTIGLELVVYVNTKRCCAKELVLFPYQICPEHRHPPIEGEPGKEETFRCRQGIVYLYLTGTKSSKLHCKLPKARAKNFTVFHEIILRPGEQYTLMPNTLHWFQAGAQGAIVSEFSTKSRDEADIFTDQEIQRITKIKK
jgi:D-lyxose ketol-isomerase